MAQALSIEIYQFLEEKLGREEARKVASAIEIGFEVIEKKAETLAIQKKLEIKNELTRELASKTDIAILEQKLDKEVELLRQEMRSMKIELEAKIEKLNQKFNFMIILLVIALTLMNPVMAEIIKNLLKL
jgi:predicted transcriptional regulator